MKKFLNDSSCRGKKDKDKGNAIDEGRSTKKACKIITGQGVIWCPPLKLQVVMGSPLGEPLSYMSA